MCVVRRMFGAQVCCVVRWLFGFWRCWFGGAFDCAVVLVVLGDAGPLLLSPCHTRTRMYLSRRCSTLVHIDAAADTHERAGLWCMCGCMLTYIRFSTVWLLPCTLL